MAVRKIAKVGDDILRKKCREVTSFDEKLSALLDDMNDTLVKADGLGIAAPQVFVLKRVAVVAFDDNYVELVNPVIVSTDGESLDNEGCLSVDGCRGIVKRPQHIVVKHFDRFGKECRLEASEYYARAVLHEMDHLDGVLFVDKMIKRIDTRGQF